MNPSSTIWIINGPNLNLLGRRTPSVYGSTTMEQILLDIQREKPDRRLHYVQSNHEGDLIDYLQQAVEQQAGGIVINAGGYTHTSVSLRDTIEYVRESDIPVVEVHISDIYAREEFRHTSLLTAVCNHSIIGLGTVGYNKAIEWIEQNC